MNILDCLYNYMLFQAKSSWDLFVWMEDTMTSKTIGLPSRKGSTYIDHMAMLTGYLWCADDTSRSKEVMFAV
jgi:hypothetical protein